MLRIAAACVLALAPVARADDPKAVAFFESKIRPALVAHCLACHGENPAKIKGGLDLTTRAGWQAGGDSGPVVEPGKPADSLLIRTLHYSDDLKMPPKGKLPESVVRNFEQWVRDGAADPREPKPAGAAKVVAPTVEAGRSFWAYQPVSQAAPPAVKNSAWPRTPVDRHVLAKLEAAGLAPAADAPPAVIARRLYVDLTGLPPTPAQLDAFEQSAIRNPQSAIEQLVDQLLASPGFGEHWGRHWLDVARFGESFTLRGILIPGAWRYRDYVIDRFNDDTPFDRFLTEQLAGDLLPAGSPEARARHLAAASFLALGNTNLEEQNKQQLRMDVVDEQLDVVTRGFLAQTVTCARCHDHKFDPIPTRDYYALAGSLRNAKVLENANVSKPLEAAMPLPPGDEQRVAAHEKKVADLKARVAALRKGAAKVGIAAVADFPGIVVDDAQAKAVGEWVASTFSKQYIGTGYRHDGRNGKGEKTLTFAPDLPAAGVYEVRLAYSGGPDRPNNVPVTVFSAEGEKDLVVDQSVPPPVEGRWVSLGSFRFEKPGQNFVLIETAGTKGAVTADAVQFLPKGVSSVGPSALNPELPKLEAELKALEASGPVRPTVVTVLEERAIEDCRVHVRGSVGTLGDVVPRGVLSVALRGPAPTFPAKESGRRELAAWVASPDNPLTARVFANRAWHWLFGRGIVPSVDNFGTTGDRPTHPELLDHLAADFVRNGWSVKKLVRSVVLSRAYQLEAAKPSAADPENRLFGVYPSRPLDAEVLRDAMLLAAGRLSPERGGPTFPASLAADYNYRVESDRRSVYLPAFRNAPPDFLAAFDGADSSLVTGARNRSTVAPQALFLLNHPFPRSQARATAERLMKLPDDAARLKEAYRALVGRDPTPADAEAAGRYLAQSESPAAGWADVVQAVLCTAEFRRHP